MTRLPLLLLNQYQQGFFVLSKKQEKRLKEGRCLVENFFDEFHVIEVLSYCSLTQKDFKDDVLRSHLAQLLLNNEVRESYDNIHKNLKQKTKYNGDYTNWIFDFTPPTLKNIKIKARFYKNKNGVYRVDEILSITNLISSIDADVYFTGEHFVDDRQSINPLATERTVKSQDNDNSHIVDDASKADVDRSKQTIMTPQVALQFQDPINSSIDHKKLGLAKALNQQMSKILMANPKLLLQRPMRLLYSAMFQKAVFGISKIILSRPSITRRIFRQLFIFQNVLRLDTLSVIYLYNITSFLR